MEIYIHPSRTAGRYETRIKRPGGKTQYIGTFGSTDEAWEAGDDVLSGGDPKKYRTYGLKKTPSLKYLEGEKFGEQRLLDVIQACAKKVASQFYEKSDIVLAAHSMDRSDLIQVGMLRVMEQYAKGNCKRPDRFVGWACQVARYAMLKALQMDAKQSVLKVHGKGSVYGK